MHFKQTANLIIAAIFTSVLSSMTAAYGQWTVTGTTAGGGVNITGRGTTLGALNQTTTPTLSSGGYDSVTLSLGSVATGGNTDTIAFTTSSNTLLNNGTITGAGGGSSGEAGFNAVSFAKASDISGETIANNGTLAGGNGGNNNFQRQGNGGDGSVGLALSSNLLNQISITNAGTINGGNGGESGYLEGSGGNGADGIHLSGSSLVTDVTLINSGTINGGSGGYGNNYLGGGGNTVSPGGIGISLGGSSMNLITINNTGSISGVNGISLVSPETNNVEITNDGNITGGNDAIVLSGSSLSNVTIINNYSLAGGDYSSGVYLNCSVLNSSTITNTETIAGGTMGSGINLNGTAMMSNVTVTNSGAVWGGDGLGDQLGFNGSPGESGINLSGLSLRNILIINSGSMTGGAGGSGGYFGDYGGGGGGSAINLSASSVSNLSINNNLTITGGNGGGGAGDGGSAIHLSASNSKNLTINNYGTISGGNAAAGGTAGIGISAASNNLTINNWGVITTGFGTSPTAIVLSGNNIRINLLGNSTVNGLIEAAGNNNILNFEFSGVSPSQKLRIESQLAPYLTGLDSSGSATILGTTYTWDPLIIHLNLDPSSTLASQGVTRSQQAVGASLDSLEVAATGNLLTLLNSISASGNVPDALEQLSPQRYEIFGDIALSNANFLTQEIDARLNNLRDGSESVDASGLSGDSTCKNCVGFSKDGKTLQCNEAAPAERWGFFASADGIFSNIGGNADLQAASFTTAGMIMGLDGRIGDHALAGLLFSYNSTTADMDSEGSTAQVDSYSTGLYGAWQADGFYANGLAAYTRNQYVTNRNIDIPGFAKTANGNSSGDQCTVNIDGGYDYHVNNRLTVGPLAGLEYVYLGTAGFDESGAGAADLAVNGQTVDSLRSRLGGRLDYHFQAGKGVALAAEVRAAWQHEFLDNSHPIGASFIEPGLAPFTVMSSNPDRDAALIGAGLNATLNDRLTLFVDYDVQLAQSSNLEQTVKGGFKWSF